MRRRIDIDELIEFYRVIGSSLWHIQHLEDVLVQFLTMKVIYERDRAGYGLRKDLAQNVLRDHRRLTMGLLFEACRKRKILRPERIARFEAFKSERHWLVHRCLIENTEDLDDDVRRRGVFRRVEAIENEAIDLAKLIADELVLWAQGHGVDLTVARGEAERRIRQLQGLKER